jgi:hypothetical protein
MMGDEEDENRRQKEKNGTAMTMLGVGGGTTGVVPPKMRLKMLFDDHKSTDGKSVEENPTSSSSKPIADLFKDCTVLFADIAGFTAWSSVREPSQVFVLLETVYAAFDRLADRRQVFKVRFFFHDTSPDHHAFHFFGFFFFPFCSHSYFRSLSLLQNVYFYCSR